MAPDNALAADFEATPEDVTLPAKRWLEDFVVTPAEAIDPETLTNVVLEPVL